MKLWIRILKVIKVRTNNQANDDYLGLVTLGIAASDYFSFIKVNFFSYYLCNTLATAEGS